LPPTIGGATIARNSRNWWDEGMAKPRLPETAPYDRETGSLRPYAYRPLDLVPNTRFPATIRFDAIERGQSAARFIATNVDTDATYPLFMTDVLHILQSATVVGGKVTGVWQAGKRGANYGLRLVDVIQ
jgi:hypothetical protein